MVNYIVRAVDLIIKTEFGLESGLASTATKKVKFMRGAKKRSAGKLTRGMVEDEKEVPAIQIFDPAMGTGILHKDGYYKPEEIVLMPIPGSGSKEFLFCVKMYCEM